MKNKQLIIVAVALVVGIGVGYLIHSPAAATAKTGPGSFAGRTGGTRGGNQAGGGFLSGTIASEDANSMTIDTRDGSSHVVLLTPATTVQKSVAGTMSDVPVGSTVMVIGTTNSDGSVSASSIQLRPAMPTQKPQPN